MIVFEYESFSITYLLQGMHRKTKGYLTNLWMSRDVDI